MKDQHKYEIYFNYKYMLGCISGLFSPVQHDVIFDNFDTCVKTALYEMTNIQNMLNTDMVNKNLLGPQFKCTAIKTT